MLTEMELEDSLVALRERAGLSQTIVAKRLGVSQPAVARLESDKVRNAKLSTLVRYAIVVGGRLKIEIAPGKQRAKIVDLKRAAKA
jgi:transcriptional regulator with XRE-family HTH domain